MVMNKDWKFLWRKVYHIKNAEVNSYIVTHTTVSTDYDLSSFIAYKNRISMFETLLLKKDPFFSLKKNLSFLWLPWQEYLLRVWYLSNYHAFGDYLVAKRGSVTSIRPCRLANEYFEKREKAIIRINYIRHRLTRRACSRMCRALILLRYASLACRKSSQNRMHLLADDASARWVAKGQGYTSDTLV